MLEPNFTLAERKTVGVIFDKIKKHANVPSEERIRKRGIVRDVLKELTSKMRENDKLFNAIYSQPMYTGSSFDNLRIKDANEFDINVVLKLPVRKDRIRLESNHILTNFAILRIDDRNRDAVVNLDNQTSDAFRRLLDDSGRVDPKKILQWMQGVLQKAYNKFTNTNYKLSVSASGPAMTLKIKPPFESYTIDVDLVAVFTLEHGAWTDNSMDFRSDIVNQTSPSSKRRMYLIPKPHPELEDCMWRKHFPEVEKELLCGTSAAKPVIRILKLLRDRCGWKNVASYFLKTLVMIEVQENNSPEYWHDSRTPDLVFAMMRKLKFYFQEKKLPHLLYRNVNLFEKLNSHELFNYEGYLTRLYNKFVTQIEYIEEFFIPSIRAVNQIAYLEGIEPEPRFGNEEEVEPNFWDEDEEEVPAQSWCTLL